MLLTDRVQQALGRLSGNQDFTAFLAWIEAERVDALLALMQSQSLIQVHQLQGSSQTLTDLLRAASAAKPTLG